MKRAPTRPPGPAPLELVLRVAGLVDPVHISIDAEAEPTIAARMRELALAGAYDRDRAVITRTPLFATMTFKPGMEPPYKQAEPRRVRHSAHTPGSVSWAWEKTPGDGRGELFVCVEGDLPAGADARQAESRGYDSHYQTIGHTDAAGLEALRSLPFVSKIKGKPVTPAAVDEIAVVGGLDVAHRERRSA